MFSIFRRRNALAVVAIAGASALGLAACSQSSAPSAAGTTITVFNGATGTLTENFNPFSPTALQPTQGVLYEPLYYYNLNTGAAPEPLLATNATWNSDGTKLTVTTRKNVQWSDGTPFTAADVAYTINLARQTPAINSNGITATATTTDANTVVLTFPSTSYVQGASILGNEPIVPEHIWKSVSEPTTDANVHPVGTGPYVLGSFTAQSYVLKKNPHYWDAGKPSIDNVRYISLSNADSASAALTGGQVDWMSSFLPGLKQLVAGHKDISYVNTPITTTELHTCSNAALGCTGPQTDVAVRQAIYYAIDRAQLNKLAADGFGETASPTLLFPDRDKSWIADPANADDPQTADIAKARSLLEGAGYTMGSDGIYQKSGQPLSLTVQVVSGYSDYITAVDTLVTQLKAAGIDLKKSQVSVNEASSNETSGRFELAIENFGASVTTNPYYMYERSYDGANTVPVGQNASSGNTARYSNPTVDAALKVAAGTNDVAVQKAQYAIIEREITRDMPYISLYINPTLTEFNNSKATGWPTTENMYAMPASWKVWDNGIVLKNLKPAK